MSVVRPADPWDEPTDEVRCGVPEPVELVWCPTCGTQPQRRCVTGWGRDAAVRPHPKRRAAARAMTLTVLAFDVKRVLGAVRLESPDVADSYQRLAEAVAHVEGQSVDRVHTRALTPKEKP